jgi:CheY-like chemotaxis protein
VGAVLRVLRTATGVDFARYKSASVRRRIARRMLLQKIDDLGNYVRHLRETPDEAQALRDDILIMVDQATTARALEVIERNTLLQARLIEDLLDVSRIVAGTLRLEAQPTMVAPAVHAALAAMQPVAEARRIVLERALDETAGPVRGDSTRLQQIVWNLVSNTIKFTPSGGRVEVRLARRGPAVELTVRDTGKGIAAEQLHHIFAPFGVAHSTSQLRGGLRLGLTIVRHLVELHGGAVQAESAGPEQGAAFTVTLPLTEERPADEAEVRTLATRGVAVARLPALGGVRVLVVDDEADMRELLRTILGQCGAEVTVAATGRTALEVLEQVSGAVGPGVIGVGEEGDAAWLRRLAPSKGAAVVVEHVHALFDLGA